ncbi:hypothetical protein SPRG_09122 [Saprolegnia parasitica CBS 223.65]|uniref:Protein kinase domain-containing protein n=1 Tax=Saprolegnia parasitica (strain CBS 223.65) TaxID=695850 RepID=A0A067CEQ9_SAPPC|nr:hypothetical protein SPRG_09122 [Saprolegnia parasitica CBS 223.65]KDO25292.1 hypothetical protein SPRG_09122 [Saprolegnia parasitica CBS 223.65]|eukprot:XP_012203950.1 hypothetical protein SPRG_09122 [Saprolegnia parasitica CBS 223.65]
MMQRGVMLLAMAVAAATAQTTPNCSALYEQYADLSNATKTPALANCRLTTIDAYCSTPACSQITNLAASIVPSCPVTSTGLLLPTICEATCKTLVATFVKAVGECQTLPLKLMSADNCRGCRKLNSTSFQSDMVSSCGQSPTGMAFFIERDSKVSQGMLICTQAPLPTDTVADSGNGSTMYVIIGIACAVLFILAATEAGGMTALDNFGNPDGFRVANDIRFDEELSQFRIPQNEIQNVSLLVKGGYGVVFHASFGKDEVAMKQLLPSKAKDHNAIQVRLFLIFLAF